MSDENAAAPTPPKQTRFVAVQLQAEISGTYGGNITVWAACADDPSRVFHDPIKTKFRSDQREEVLDMLENLIRWGGEERKYHVEFVVWNRDRLVSLLAEGGDESLVTDWLDFTSYFAGSQGLTHNEARAQLTWRAVTSTPLENVQLLARLFANLQRFAVHQRALFESACALKATYEGAFKGGN